MSNSVTITVKVDKEILDEYIEHVKMYNYWYAKRHESEKYHKKAMEHQKMMNQILWKICVDDFVTLERITGKPIPFSEL